MVSIKKKILIALALLVIFYITLSYEFTGTFICNIFKPDFYFVPGNIYKVLFSFAVVLCVAIFGLLLNSKYLRNNHLLNLLFTEKSFLIFMICSGFIISVLVPLYQIPDEPTHISLIYEELGLNASFSTYFGQFNEPIDYIHNQDLKIDALTYFTNETLLSIPSISAPVSVAIVKHFPQAIGLVICSIFHCSIFVTSVVCESFAVLFSSFICYIALRLIPSRKLLFASLMALPLCIQQNGSFSYDAVLVPTCFLLFAYLMNIKFVKKDFNTKDLLLILMMVIIIAIIKIPYVLIGSIIFLIPSKKFSFKFFNFKLDYKN